MGSRTGATATGETGVGPPRPRGAAAVLSVVRAYPFLIGTLVLGIVALGLQLAGQPDSARILVTAVSVAGAAAEATRMVRALLHGRAGLDVLALLAIVSTLLVGEYWASLVIVLMLEGGEALERYAGRRAATELSALLARAPQTAHRLLGHVPEDVPLDDVQPGDLLLVRPGEVLPVDGILQTDAASLDESQLTGESLPVLHQAGDRVLSGTLSLGEPILITASATAKESQYQRVIDLVRDAAESRAPMVRLADRYALPFTGVALALGATGWILSGDPQRFAEVLVVATPCPLLLAAPIAFVSGISRAAGKGIIVRSGSVLELLARAKTVAFDKTGTLTVGRPEVVTVRPASGESVDELV